LCTCEFVHAFTDAGAWFSVTVPQWKSVTRAISMITEEEWVGILSPHAVVEEDTGQWISDAEVAEVPFHRLHLPPHKESGHLQARRAPRQTVELSRVRR